MAPRVLVAGMLVVIAIFGFVIPWVTVADTGGTIGITLSRSVKLLGRTVESHNPGWAIFFAVVLGLMAAAVVFAVDDAESFVGARRLAASVTVILVVATWVGRSVWVGSVGEDVSLRMGWGFWIALVIAVAIFFVPARIGSGRSAD